MPGFVKDDQRCCFGIYWFDSEEAADAFAKIVRDRGDTYNGGFFHGARCGRDRSWDCEELLNDSSRRLYAVTS